MELIKPETLIAQPTGELSGHWKLSYLMACSNHDIYGNVWLKKFGLLPRETTVPSRLVEENHTSPKV